ncbi:MAG: phosphoribosylanthranilate isomerase [Saprospiraceae bacterium]
MMKLKICGLKHPDNARQLLTLAPDYLGFIFYKKSPRYVGEPADLDWVKNLPGPTQKVGVFVNEDVEIMKKTAELLDLQVIQLHGEEPPEVCRFLKEEGLEVWKVFGVDEDFDFGKTKPYAGVADKFLFDTKGKNRGGNGVAFDWSLLGKYEGETPFVLSGGIGPLPLTPKGEPTDFQVSELRKLWRSDNRASEGSTSGVRGLTVLDINSRFETEPGLKDFNLVKKFKHELFS